MRLVSLVLYNAAGESVVIDFRRGLNVITGSSATGKSALLEMVEFCLGRDTLTTPVGPIRDTIAWYGLLVELPNQRAFVGRPAPASGNASTQRGMLEFGVELQIPSFSDLLVNADTAAIRDQLGRALGIDENETDPTGQQPGFEANLGHAVLFCLQRQSEIASRELLFHRQGEEGITRALREVLPYFLGAVAKDRAVLRQRLLAASRDLRSSLNELRTAEAADADIGSTLRAFVTEARGAGLLGPEPISGTAAALDALRRAVGAPLAEVSLDDADAAERDRLRRRRDVLRHDLYQLGQEQAVLETLETDQAQYEGVVAQQAARLRSLELIGDEAEASATGCPLCGSELPAPDPTIEEMRTVASQLRDQAGTFGVTRPRRRRALDDVARRGDRLRVEIRSIDQALDALEVARREVVSGRRFGDRQAFLQGRIQHYLETAQTTGAAALNRLQERVRTRESVVAELEVQIDPDEEREQLVSRLVAIGRDMTAWADRLGLEHSGTSVRLDANRLTAVADTSSGPAPLNQIGSAANWIGYHLVTHLALHKFFVEQARPVPHFLMLDQPTQAYYPSDVTRESGVPASDADRRAVQAMFRLMADVAQGLGDELQIIVCDHANLPDPWFQDAVIKDWRDGRRLIPQAWINT